MEVKGFDLSSATENRIAETVAAGRFPHACIIEGGSEEYRLELARKIAGALICGNKETVPCGICSHCHKALKHIHPDIEEYYPKTDKGKKEEAFSADYVRDIRDKVFIIPNEADKKIVILSNAQRMNDTGQNSLLKILEEPPGYAYFIFLCPSKDYFLDTILSRVTVWSLSGGTEAEGAAFTREELAEAAEKMMKAMLSGSEYEIMKSASVFDKNQKLLQETLPVIKEILATALRIKYNAPEETGFETAAETAAKLPAKSIAELIDFIDELWESMNYHVNLNLAISRLSSRLRKAAGGD